MGNDGAHQNFTVRIPAALRRDLRTYAAQRGVTAAYVVRTAMEEKIAGNVDEVRAALDKLMHRIAHLEQRERVGATT